MSSTKNEAKLFLKVDLMSAAIRSVISMILTMLLMLACSTLIASGKMPERRSGEYVMLCVFLSNCIPVLFAANKRDGGGVLPMLFGCLFYVLILLILAMSAGSQSILGAGFFRMVVCAVAGSLLGCSVKMRKSSPSKTRRKKRYNYL